ncbi:MAG: NAD(P)H-dependent flavin oxidoreductase [Oligoflexus sp.]
METKLTKILGIEYPVIGGAMYPCSNPELVAAVSEAGGIGIVQPISLVFVNSYKFREGLQYIRSLTKKPIGLNLLIEKSSQKYLEKNKEWLEIALEEGVRFFITALGSPRWVVDIAKKHQAVVFHDVTSAEWAKKAVDSGVDGLICVNKRAGGHLGEASPEELHQELQQFGLPLVCAGGIGDSTDFYRALEIGYDGVQMGTRFIASKECTAHEDYKAAIVKAGESDIVATRKLTGVPVSVINTPYIQQMGTEPGALAAFLLRSPKTKHWARTFYSLRSVWQLRRSLRDGNKYREYYQAGRSVHGVKQVESVAEIMKKLVRSPEVQSSSQQR